jgi:hypothetical protein
MDADEGENGAYQVVGSQTIDGDTKTWFDDPITLYGDISRMKQNHDFYGWGIANSFGENNANVLVNLDRSINKWDE